jgi:hypothetical protein
VGTFDYLAVMILTLPGSCSPSAEAGGFVTTPNGQCINGASVTFSSTGINCIVLLSAVSGVKRYVRS